jgi:hypothetical protein
MKIDDLKTKIEEFNFTQVQIQKNRQIWTDETKTLLINTLNKIAEKFDIGWYVQVMDLDKNSEGVNITFKPTRSGIIRKNETSMKSFLKEGGTIAFSQAYNGEIFVIILYPFVKDFVSESENKLLGKFNPSLINEDFIVKKVSIFIDEMIKWEKTTYNKKIGFKIDQNVC